MRVLLVGCGSIGRRHLNNLRALRDVEAIAYRHRPAPEPGLGLRTVASLAEGLAARPDFAIVANPTALHVPVAAQVAEAGVPLFLEKPVSDRLDGVMALVRDVEERGLLSFVGYNLRFHPGLRRMKQWLDEGRAGRPLLLRAEVGQYLPDWRPGRDYRQGYGARRALGGGVILDLSHELDLVRWLLGPVRELAAMADHVSDMEIDCEDAAEIVLRLESGAMASVHLDYLQRTPLRRCRVVGSEGTLEWDYYAGRLRLFESQTGAWREESFDGFERNDMYLEELRHFLRCLEEQEQPLVTLGDGVAVLALALAARRSAEMRQFVGVEEGLR